MTQNPQPTSYQIRLVASRSLSPFEEEERDLAVRALLPEMDVENPVFLSISSAAVSIPIEERKWKFWDFPQWLAEALFVIIDASEQRIMMPGICSQRKKRSLPQMDQTSPGGAEDTMALLTAGVLSQVKSSGANPRLITSNVGSIDRRIGMFQKGRSSLIILLRTFWYVLPPNYRSDPADEKENSALLLSRRTYPPRDSWNFCGLRWGKSTKARQIDRLLSRC
ncbi:hypothetical protein L1987_28206 [Smallanthus sonchifolius]|uniref:Uncharacterized protein n=1 Tax=Smallanthus sonchifolius TaxID=185202 RepID=A0ACB9IBK3_9ASTR|nr:hypothetical protein L1987_28206 [Smallanthus sonchifolius]